MNNGEKRGEFMVKMGIKRGGGRFEMREESEGDTTSLNPEEEEKGM